MVLAPAGQANEKVVFPQEVHPIRAGKNQLQDKKPPLPHKRKNVFPRKGYAPSVRRPSRATSATPSENHPPRRRGYQQTWYSIPPTQRQWRKRDHGSLKRWPPETEGYPKVFYPRDPITAQIQRPVVSYLAKISTGLPFLFRSPEPLFLLLGKRKSGFTRKGYAPSVRWQSRQRLGCGPSRAGKKPTAR